MDEGNEESPKKTLPDPKRQSARKGAPPVLSGCADAQMNAAGKEDDNDSLFDSEISDSDSSDV